MIDRQLILDGQSYPVHGMNGFKRSLISMFPPKLTIGDTNKDDEQFVATWETNVASGGIGLYRMLDRSQTDRAYWSGLNLSYHSGITLPPYVANYGRPTGTVVPLTDGLDFLTHTYVVFGKALYRLVDTMTDGGTGSTNFTTSYSQLSAPGTITATHYATAGSTLANVTYNVQVVAVNAWGSSIASTLVTVTPLVNEMANLAFAAVTNATSYKVYLSTDASPKLVNTFTEAQRASGGFKCSAVGVTSAGAAPANSVDIGVVGTGELASVNTLDTNINAITVWNNKLWILSDNRLRSSVDGTTWVDDTATLVPVFDRPQDDPALNPAQTAGGQFMAVHDGLLWIINGYDVFKQGAGLWSYQGSLDKIYTIRKLLDYINVAGEPTLYALTSGGAYIADESATPAVWSLTAYRWPIGTNSGKAGKVWRADLYTYTGLDGYKYTGGTTSTSTVDASIGLSRDGGVPINYDGAITYSADALNDLFVLVDQSTTTQTTEAASTFRHAGHPFPHYSPRFNYISNFSSYIAQWSGSAWTIPWISPRSPATIAPGGMFISQNNTYRTYWSWNGDMYGIDLPKGLRNPWQNTISRFQRGPIQHISPWFQGLAESLDKVGLNLKLFTQNMSTTETIRVSYGLDFSESWTQIPNPADATTLITTNGLHTLRLGPSTLTTPPIYLGLEYSAIRFLFEFDRSATDKSKSPSLFYWLHQFQKQFEPRWGFTITLDLTQDYLGRTPAQMVSDLLNLVEKVNLVAMQYKDPSSLVTGAYAVKITHVQASENTAFDARGIWNISLIQPVS